MSKQFPKKPKYTFAPDGTKLKWGKPCRMRVNYPYFPHKETVPTGKQLLAMIDESGYKIPDDERQRILSMVDEEEMKVFLNANLAAMEPHEAKSDMARFIMKLDIPSTLITSHFTNLRAVQFAIDFAKTAMDTMDLPIKDKSDITRTYLMAIHEKNLLIRDAMRLVGQMFEKPSSKPKKIVQKTAQLEIPAPPRNKPPDTSAPQPNLDARIANVMAKAETSP